MADEERPPEEEVRSGSIFDGSLRPMDGDDSLGGDNPPGMGRGVMLPVGAFLALALVLVLALLLGRGRERPDLAHEGDAALQPPAEVSDFVEHEPWQAEALPARPSLEVPPDFEVDMAAPIVEEAHPGLASGALARARLMDLPDGFLLLSPTFGIGQEEVAAQIAEAPRELRDELSKNAFVLLEQSATESLLVEEALREAGESGMDERDAIQAHFRRLTEAIEVSEADVEQFFHENREMIGGASLEDIGPRIRQFLVQQKQGETLDRHIRTLAERTPVAVSAPWAAEQARLARDNAVDRARASGKPTFASFGADTCQPCVAMEPVRDAAREKYAGKANVVYVHVGQEQILASRYGVQGIPMLVFFDAEGKEVHRHTGMMSQEEVEERLEGLIR